MPYKNRQSAGFGLWGSTLSIPTLEYTTIYFWVIRQKPSYAAGKVMEKI